VRVGWLTSRQSGPAAPAAQRRFVSQTPGTRAWTIADDRWLCWLSNIATVAELVDLVEHEPKRGGVLGASAAEHDKHVRGIRGLITVLRSS
jgi:hypothetical protein